MFRLTFVLALVGIAVWLFMGGHHSASSGYDGTPSWLLETPSWILRTVTLVLAILVAVVPEKLQDIIADLLDRGGGG